MSKETKELCPSHDINKARRQRLSQRILKDDAEDSDLPTSDDCVSHKMEPSRDNGGASVFKSKSDRGEHREERNSLEKRAVSREVSRSSQRKSVGNRAQTTRSPCIAKETFVLSDTLDTSQHQPECFVCGESLKKTASNTENNDKLSHQYCTSCLRSYHTACVSAVHEFSGRYSQDKQNSSYWCCPKCLGCFFIRDVPFYRHGIKMQRNSDYELYLKETIGLTGYFQNCARCGISSSQHRVAVICDNCEREWHLQCLKLEELPWGTWFCPDCIDLHICAACVLLQRELSETSENEISSLTSNGSASKKHGELKSAGRRPGSDGVIDIAVQYYHDGALITCSICYLRFHPECVVDCYVPFECPQNISQIYKKKKFFWCCASCQEYLGIQRIVSQRLRNKPSVDSQQNLSSCTSQIDLLVKMKTQSYHRLMWLSLERVKAIYPIGARKWLATPEASKLLSALDAEKLNHLEQSYTLESTDEEDGGEEEEQDDFEIDNDEQDNEKDEDEKGEFYQESTLEFKELDASLAEGNCSFDDKRNEYEQVETFEDFVDLNKNASGGESKQSDLPGVSDKKGVLCYNLSKKRVESTGSYNDFYSCSMKRPSCVKKEWLIPSRVFGKRFCPRGTFCVEYYVKWSCLSYEESTWESAVSIQSTSAWRMFRAITVLEKMIKCKPITIQRIHNRDPTVPDPLPYCESNHPLPPKNTVLVKGTKYIIQTFSADGCHKEGSSYCSALEPKDGSSLEKCQRDTKAGSFAPYLDRPLFLNGYYLFDYQLEGINWLRYAWSKKRSVILADEMGLGKTVQVVSFLGSLWNDLAVQGPFLVVAPLATLEDVWVRELKHWVPFMNAVSYFGNPEARQICVENELFIYGGPGAKAWYEGACLAGEREPEYNRPFLRCRLPKISDGDTFAKFDVIVTSYEMFRKDHWLFRQIQWKVIVVDEGHRLKNFDSEIKKSLESCTSTMRLLLTGTPLQNSIDELFSLLNVLHPEQFPESRKNEYQGVVTEESTIEKLKKELQLHILRRTKRDVMGGRMPAKKERLIFVENSPTQREMYRNIILRNHVLLSSDDGSSNVLTKRNVRATSLRNVVMQMRKCCNHPYLFDESPPIIRTEDEFRNLVEASGKLHLLDRMLQVLLKRGHRVLVFSQFMRMLNILEEYLNYRRYGFERLDGSTSAVERQRAIDRFNTQPHKKFVFLLSTRAGGLGINLTSADTVIIYDSDWNPHNDLQAQARVHRLGQTKKVAIYRFMTRATVEERIIETAKNKLVLDQVVAGRISLGDMDAMVRCGAQELFSETNPSKQVHYDDVQLEQLLSRESDSEGDDNVKEGDANTSIKESVLGSFKVARFYETSAESAHTFCESNAEFWENLVKDKLLTYNENNTLNEVSDKNNDLKIETLGRGMRARKEVLHFGNFTSRETAVSAGESDDEDDEYDCDAVDESDVDEKKAGSQRDNRSNGLLDLSKKCIQGNKKTLKPKKKRVSFFDSYVIFICSWKQNAIENCVVITNPEQGAAFNATYASVLPQFLDQISIIRRRLGLAEKAKLARRMLLSNITSELSESNIFNLPDAIAVNDVFETQWYHAFQLKWNKQWLQKILAVQLSKRTLEFQPYIVENSHRYFVLSSPVILNDSTQSYTSPSQSHFQYIGLAMRELTSDELMRWQTQLYSNLHRCAAASSMVPSLPECLKASLRACSALHISTTAQHLNPTYPDYVSVRKALKRSRITIFQEPFM